MNYNFDLEYSIIGTLLTSKESLKHIDKIEPEMFYNNTCKELYLKARECCLTKQEFTEFTAVEHLKSVGQDQETAFNHVLKCSENVITSYNLKSDVKLLESLYRKRELESIIKKSLESTEDFETNTEKLLQELYDLRRNNKSTKKTIKSMLEATADYMEFLNDDTNKDRVDTGFPLIDSMLKGMFPGQLIGLAARPGCGKSAMALNIAINAAKRNKKVVIFSQEMESNELIERMVANQAIIPMNSLIDKFAGEANNEILINKTVSGLSYLSKLPVFIADTTTVTTMKIRNECQHISGLSLIIIDYLTLMKPLKREQNRNLEVGQITRELKILANELQCPILLLSQLNRAKDETDKPSLNDYRDSGSVEQDITKSMMLWKTDIENNKIGLTINKNRRGSCGDVELQFNGNYMMFTEIGLYQEPPKKKIR